MSVAEREKKLTIVYQFGKVASTSLVNTLKSNPALDVHQSHFLGESALQRIVPIAVDRATNGYFHEHLVGQLMANVGLTYRMNQVLGGQGKANLKVISLSREPLDWLRSGILQDIDGYRVDLAELAMRAGRDDQDPDAALIGGLEEALSRIGALIDDKGGIENTVAEFHAIGGKAMLAPQGYGAEMIVRRLFFLALRPLTWFEEHFRPCFGIGLDAFEHRDGYWVAARPRADFVIMRYEDLAEVLLPATRAIGLHLSADLMRDNISRTKPFAKAVAAAFSTPAALALRQRLLSSAYARFFRYDAKQATPHAAE
ncbi:MAG: hypothetical protein LJE62_04685 [Silicimonas sp.]|nr:hypothetical protein [Silicimonas sp.]